MKVHTSAMQVTMHAPSIMIRIASMLAGKRMQRACAP